MLNTSLTLTFNFAYGGATTSAALVTPYEPTVLSFVDQVGEFNASIAKHPAGAPWTSENSLFGVWIGVNDVGNSWYEANETQRLNEIMDVYFDQLKVLHSTGARNFVLLSVPREFRPVCDSFSGAHFLRPGTINGGGTTLLTPIAPSHHQDASGA